MNTRNILWFIGGVITGSVATYFVVKERSDAAVEAEIAAFHEYNDTNSAEPVEVELNVDLGPVTFSPEEGAIIIPLKPSLEEMASKIQSEEKYDTPFEGGGGKLMRDGTIVRPDIPKPYVVDGDELHEDPAYDTIGLTYYADKILADDDESIIDDVSGMVGKDSLEGFDDEETDVIYVKNERVQTIFEISRDSRRYTEMFIEHPFLAKD